MQCAQCGFAVPDTHRDSTCVKCGGPLEITAEELLSNPKHGFVREIRPGQIELTKAIEEALKRPTQTTVFAEGGCGVGKAQPLDARILCPDRWRAMGSMEVGMPINGCDGQTYQVTGVYPQGQREVFRVTFTDGSNTTCCEEHLWLVQNKKDRARRRPGRVRMLRDLLAEGLKNGREHRHWIPIVSPIQREVSTLPIDPYLLGVLLGDGGFTASANVHITKHDTFIVDELHRLIPPEDVVSDLGDHTYSIISRTPGRWTRSRLTQLLEALGLWGLLSTEKFIPVQYLWAAFTDRVRLLQGLCDTDGGNCTNNAEFSSSSTRLAHDVRELVQSLGGITSFKSRIPTYMYNNERRTGHLAHRLVFTLPPDLTPFCLPRKRDAYIVPTKYFPRRAIKHVEAVGRQETQCITTSAPDQLYVTDDYIVTHNTFAYGTPAALSKRRVVICTAKKSLQDQLETKDIPYLQKKLGVPRTFVSVKGKSNYACKRLILKNKKMFEQQGNVELWEQLVAWVDDEKSTGDLNAFPNELAYPATICTAEECIGRCKYAKTCGYWTTKDAMKEADLIVTNHSLLGFDLRFGVGKLLGPYQILVIDEAHAAPDFLRRAFAEEVSETWLKSFLRKIGREQIDLPAALDEKKVVPPWEKMFKLVPDERLLQPNCFDAALLKQNSQMLRDIQDALYWHVAREWVPSVAPDAKMRPDFGALAKEAQDNILGGRDYANETFEDGESEAEEELIAIVKFYTKLETVHGVLQATTTDEPDYILCREETRTGKVKIIRQPVNLAPFVRGPLKSVEKVVFTSATLNSELLKTEIGVDPEVEVCQASPFNYKANGLVYIPQHLSRPNEDEWPFEVAQELVQLIRASKGNGLVLFSAKTDLQRVLDSIDEHYELEYPIYAQTDNLRPKEVMRLFEETENSVIFGLRSFFEGIDIQGSKLRLVVLAKIPFPHMKDPLCQAKKEQLGQSAWWKGYYYPTMLTEVQQAAGRLIRTATDKGVLAILDVRMWVGGNKGKDPKTVGTSKSPWTGYGHQIFRALPFENYTPRLHLVLRYLEKISSE